MIPIILTTGWNCLREVLSHVTKAIETNPNDKAAVENVLKEHKTLAAALTAAQTVELPVGQALGAPEIGNLLQTLGVLANTSVVPDASSSASSIGATAPTMRAKLQIGAIAKYKADPGAENSPVTGIRLEMFAVCADKFGPDGEDENNTYARYSPSAAFSIYIANPNLFDKFEEGQRFYVDFTLAPDRSQSVPPATSTPSPEPLTVTSEESAPAPQIPVPSPVPTVAETSPVSPISEVNLGKSPVAEVTAPAPVAPAPSALPSEPYSTNNPSPLGAPEPSGVPIAAPGAAPSEPEPVSSTSASASDEAAPESAPSAVPTESSSSAVAETEVKQ